MEYESLYDIHFKFIESGKYHVMYCQNIITFDIETSSGFLTKDGKVREYNLRKYDRNINYRNLCDNSKPISLMYIWQFAIEDLVTEEIYTFYGRTWDEYEEFVNALTMEIRRQAIFGFNSYNRMNENFIASRNKKSVQAKCYIHNMSFEMQFLRNVWEKDFKKVFARNTHRPMRFHINVNKVHFEHRCTYFLTQKSLSDWCKDEKLPVQKHKPINYAILRTPLTPLSDEEISYSLADVVSMVWGLRKYREKYGTLEKIPLTQTGEVRLDVIEKVCKQNPEWANLMVSISSTYTPEQYKKLVKLFQGGWTHANATKVGNIYNCVCFDFASSYPATLTQCTYPVSEFETVPNEEFWELEKQDIYHPQYHWFAHIRVKGLCSKLQNSYWSLSKTYNAKHSMVDNGRLKMLGEGDIWLSDLDWDTFKRVYNMQGIEILEVQKAKAGYLCKELILAVLDYYGGKTKLKGTGQDSLYMSKKQMANGIYGCFVTKVAMDQVEFKKNEGWNVTHFEDLGDEYFYDIISRLNPEKQFGCYQLGIWCTSWARHRLWDFIEHFDKKIVYCDTDSIKGTFDQNDIDWVNNYNENIRRTYEKVAQYYGFDKELYEPKTIKGISKPLGFMEREHDCRLKTLGAKRYVAEWDEKGKHCTETTIAGLPKKAGAKKVKRCEDLTNHTTWEAYLSGKQTAHYNDKQPPATWVGRDGQPFYSEDKYGITLAPATFDLSMAPEFEAFLEVLNGSISLDDDRFNDQPLFVYD